MSTNVKQFKGIIVEWTGEEKIIPKYGYIKTGEQIYLPIAVAESFIKQGLAIAPTKRKPKQED